MQTNSYRAITISMHKPLQICIMLPDNILVQRLHNIMFTSKRVLLFIYIQECFARVFFNKIVLFQIDNDTYRLSFRLKGRENFVRRTQK